MLVYFAQPIDQARREYPAERQIRSLLAEAGISTFNPSRAYSLAENPMSDLLVLDSINRLSLAAADGLVAWIPASMPTLGVPAEIEQVLTSGKPVVIFTPQSLLMKSVQMWQWRERGATILAVEDIERMMSRPQDLVDLLRVKPESTLVEGTLELISPPPLLVKYERGGSELTRAYTGDAGLDLAVATPTHLADNEYRLIPTGVRAAVPHGWWGFITGRSSSWAKWGLDIRTAVIDSGYRGELMIGVHNKSGDVRYIQPGARLAQYVLIPAFMGQVVEVQELPEHERGDNGYGSSGE